MHDVSFSFHSPVHAHFGTHALSILKDLLAPHGRIGIVSGKTAIHATGFFDELKGLAPHAEFIHFDEVEANPSINTIIKGGNVMRDGRADVIVAFGGGSPLDAAKAIAVFAANRAGFYENLGKKEFDNPPVPLIAIPTTAGTGSEMNNYAIVTDVEKKDKINFNNAYTFPKHAILHPPLLSALSEPTMLATVFDAFTHAFEGFLSNRSTPFSDMIAVQSMQMIMDVLEDGDVNTDRARSRLMYASSLAGIVILHTGTTLLHALGYYLTNHKGVHHGTANAILMPSFSRMLRDSNVPKFRVVDAMMSGAGFDVVEFLPRMNAKSLAELFDDSDLDALVEYALAKPNTPSTPFTATFEFVRSRLS